MPLSPRIGTCGVSADRRRWRVRARWPVRSAGALTVVSGSGCRRRERRQRQVRLARPSPAAPAAPDPVMARVSRPRRTGTNRSRQSPARRCRRSVSRRAGRGRGRRGDIRERGVEPIEIRVERNGRCTARRGTLGAVAGMGAGAHCFVRRRRRAGDAGDGGGRRRARGSSFTRPITSCGSNGFASTPSQPASAARLVDRLERARSAAPPECAPASATA